MKSPASDAGESAEDGDDANDPGRVSLLRPGASEEEIQKFLSYLNEGMPQSEG